MGNERVIMHQMEIKGKRLNFGLKKFVDAYEGGGADYVTLYAYALACLGDEKSKAKVAKLPACEDIYRELLEEGLVKEETAKKMMTEGAKNKDKFVGEKKKPEREKNVEANADDQSRAEDAETPVLKLSSFAFSYDTKTRRPSREGVPEPLLKVFDAIEDAWVATKKFPLSVRMENGDCWMRLEPKQIGDGVYTIPYLKEI